MRRSFPSAFMVVLRQGKLKEWDASGFKGADKAAEAL
jgi:hypothetical protein